MIEQPYFSFYYLLFIINFLVFANRRELLVLAQ